MCGRTKRAKPSDLCLWKKLLMLFPSIHFNTGSRGFYCVHCGCLAPWALLALIQSSLWNSPKLQGFYLFSLIIFFSDYSFYYQKWPENKHKSTISTEMKKTNNNPTITLITVQCIIKQASSGLQERSPYLRIPNKTTYGLGRIWEMFTVK